jgi:molybdopterin/thiamine biosynthesis adenylyltransferase
MSNDSLIIKNILLLTLVRGKIWNIKRILGPVPGIMEFIQAAEAVNLLGVSGNGLTGRMLFPDGLASEFLSINLHKKRTCPLCGKVPA